jgi:hypothetical protein
VNIPSCAVGGNMTRAEDLDTSTCSGLFKFSRLWRIRRDTFGFEEGMNSRFLRWAHVSQVIQFECAFWRISICFIGFVRAVQYRSIWRRRTAFRLKRFGKCVEPQWKLVWWRRTERQQLSCSDSDISDSENEENESDMSNSCLWAQIIRQTCTLTHTRLEVNLGSGMGLWEVAWRSDVFLPQVQAQVRPLVRPQHLLSPDTNPTQKICHARPCYQRKMLCNADLRQHDFSTGCYSKLLEVKPKYLVCLSS